MTDKDLIEQTEKLVASERKIIQQILLNLKEIERRKLHLKRGYSSLFAFCTESLGYSEAAAFRRIEAMRAIKELPNLGEKLERGELTLSNVALAQKVIRSEVKRSGLKIDAAEKAKVFSEIENKTYKEASRLLVTKYPEALPKESTRVVTSEHTKIQFVADSELVDKLEKLKNHFSHKNPNPSYNELLHLMADAVLKPHKKRMRLEPDKVNNSHSAKSSKVVGNDIDYNKSGGANSLNHDKSTGARSPNQNQELNLLSSSGKSAKTKSGPQLPNRSRYIKKSVREEVLHRDRGQCQYQDPVTGRQCGSVHLIQFDHIWPKSKGGQNTAENLQLLCASHNQLKGAKYSSSGESHTNY